MWEQAPVVQTATSTLQHFKDFHVLVPALHPLCPVLQNGRKKNKKTVKRIVKSIEVDVYKKVQTFVLVNMCFLFSPLTLKGFQ